MTRFAATMMIAFLATSAHAANELRLLDVCLRADHDISIMSDRLSEFGWVETSEKTDTLTNGLKWIGTTQYFTTDSGGELLETILDLKERTAAGLLRKKDIPQSKNRFLVREDEVLHVMWRKPTPAFTEVECHAALSPTTVEDIQKAHGALTTAFTRLPTRKSDGGQVDISLLNSYILESYEAPAAILRTYIQVQDP